MAQQQTHQDTQERTQPHGFLRGTHDEVERVQQLYVDGEIDEAELEARLTEQQLQAHEQYQRRQRRARREWLAIAGVVVLAIGVLFVWSQFAGGVPI